MSQLVGSGRGGVCVVCEHVRVVTSLHFALNGFSPFSPRSSAPPFEHHRPPLPAQTPHHTPRSLHPASHTSRAQPRAPAQSPQPQLQPQPTSSRPTPSLYSAADAPDEQALKALRDAFTMIDTDNSGTISASEFGTLLRLQVRVG